MQQQHKALSGCNMKKWGLDVGSFSRLHLFLVALFPESGDMGDRQGPTEGLRDENGSELAQTSAKHIYLMVS